ncbi:hypothetical protein GCM10025791_08650 [Halioxenophilus aromaticivorans]|uniref:Alginate export domain-containing protein n=2 Tax=Halioxenophilus aromaticivorans TaxID=1306992 RepID=A0AAV3TZZ3_9ALTE
MATAAMALLAAGVNAVDLSVTGQVRLRYENLDQQFRASGQGSDQALLARTLVLAELTQNRWTLAGELIDARGLLSVADEDTTLGTSSINPLDIQQTYLRYQMPSANCSACYSRLTAGRYTLDIGSRRFVARNRYRNTLNNFTGLHWQHQSTADQQWQVFYSQPVTRRFDGDATDNSPKLDKENHSTQFYGLYFADALTENTKTELYWLGLGEQRNGNDSARNIQTLVNWWQTQQKSWRGQIEWAYQWGEVREGTNNLDKKAAFLHTEIEWQEFIAGIPLTLFFDYASGDKNRSDNEDNSFDTLFGARRFDFGPTSIYGPFARTNLISPGASIELNNPFGQWQFTWRYFRLASNDEPWSSAGIDPQTTSGAASNVAQQLELRWRTNSQDDHWQWEAGLNYLKAEQLMQAADKNNATYVYGQIAYQF